MRIVKKQYFCGLKCICVDRRETREMKTKRDRQGILKREKESREEKTERGREMKKDSERHESVREKGEKMRA